MSYDFFITFILVNNVFLEKQEEEYHENMQRLLPQQTGMLARAGSLVWQGGGGSLSPFRTEAAVSSQNPPWTRTSPVSYATLKSGR